MPTALLTPEVPPWTGFQYIYPVLSRRSKGISIGINLNPSKACNFDCVYCQVDRSIPGKAPRVHIPDLESELEELIQLFLTRELFKHPPFKAAPAKMQRLNDIAFAGEGEPTTCPNFPEIVRKVAGLRDRLLPSGVKMVLITNSSALNRPRVMETLHFIHQNHGEIWAKLDAGSEKYFRQIDRSRISLDRILKNITHAARQVPLILQSMFIRMHGIAPSDSDIDAYISRIQEILSAGGKISHIQVYTLARKPTEPWVTALTPKQTASIAIRVQNKTGVKTEFYS